MSFQRDFGTYIRLAAEHFWPWNSNAPRTAATATFLRIGGRMHDDEVLAAGFADQPRIAAILAEVLADLLPHAVEHAGAAGEMNAGEIGMIEDHVRDRDGIAGHEVDDAGGQARRFEQTHHVVRAQHRGARGLPQHCVAHERGRAGEVAADRREVERRHRVDEAFERAVLHLVPDGMRAVGLLGQQLLCKRDVEAPEVDELRCGIDLAWNAVFDCPSIVAATTVDRQVVVSSSAARRNTAARSSNAQLDHSLRALTAAAAA
jgi:hypothetical protein